MPREVAEWIGKTPDSKIPMRVQLRVWRKWEGKCHLSGVKITGGMAWQLDHIIPLIKNGENRESNLAPATVEAHKAKTREEVGEKAKIDRIAAKHLGIKPRRTTAWAMSRKFKRKMDGTVVRR